MIYLLNFDRLKNIFVKTIYFVLHQYSMNQNQNLTTVKAYYFSFHLWENLIDLFSYVVIWLNNNAQIGNTSWIKLRVQMIILCSITFFYYPLIGLYLPPDMQTFRNNLSRSRPKSLCLQACHWLFFFAVNSPFISIDLFSLLFMFLSLQWTSIQPSNDWIPVE